jgi:hypothetical protein
MNLSIVETAEQEKQMQEFYDVSELVDPRPFDGIRSTYRGMPLLPISYDCDWMVFNRVLLSAACKEVFVIGCEALPERTPWFYKVPRGLLQAATTSAPKPSEEKPHPDKE